MKKYEKASPQVKRILSDRDELLYYLSRNNRTVEEEFFLIRKKESNLPKRLRDFITLYFEELNETTENTETIKIKSNEQTPKADS